MKNLKVKQNNKQNGFVEKNAKPFFNLGQEEVMRKNTTDEQRMRTPFGRYVNTINDETDYDDNDEIFSDKIRKNMQKKRKYMKNPLNR